MRKAFTLVLAAALAALFAADSAAFAKSLRGTERGGDRVRLEARLSGKTLASGKSRYQERTRVNVVEQRFKVQVEDFAPDQTLTIMLNGEMIGTVTTNALGRAELQFRTAAFIDDPGDGDPIGEFPPIEAGDTISVGPLSGTFVLD